MITTLDDAKFIEAVARAAHEVNNAYRYAIGQTPHQPWSFLTPLKKSLSKIGVYAALSGATPKQLHEKWMEEKVKAGWVYGPAHDEEYKKHPCIVSWDELPNYERAKDELFVNVVRAMVAAVETGRQK